MVLLGRKNIDVEGLTTPGLENSHLLATNNFSNDPPGSLRRNTKKDLKPSCTERTCHT